jgi:CRP-like cAMP-binding protein
MLGKSDINPTFISNSPLFTGLEPEEVGRLVELAEVQEFKGGEVIVEEGSMGDAIFLLYEGKLSVGTKGKKGRTITLAKLKDRGAFFGEIALADPGPRSATVKADGQAVLLVLSLESLEAFFAQFPEARVVILRNIARVLARRLREANALLASTSSAS